MRIPIRKILFLFVFLLSTGCTNNKDVLLIETENTCKLPCWNGILPDSTEKEKAVEILKNIQQVDTSSIQTGFAQQFLYPDYISANLKNSSSGYCMIYLKNDIVQMIELERVTISLSEVIEIYGEPNEIIFYIWGNNLGVNLLFQDSKLWIRYSQIRPSTNEIRIFKNTKITSMMFLNDASSTLLFKEELSDYFQRFGQFKNIIWQSWNGFGKYAIPPIN